MSTADVASPTSPPTPRPSTSASRATNGRRRSAGEAKPPRGPAANAPASGARTTRVVLRNLDPWTVLKLSLVYYLALFFVLLVAGA
ncbi:MAG: hypothetical protein QOI47_2209, partial [Actinomycetota bacterium]|nr:hypothetical protein [Actinomycetota bacterium]